MTAVSDLNANSLRQPKPAHPTSGHQVVESPDDLNSAPRRSKRAQAEAERRAKKKYAERWHKSVGRREQVCDVRGYSGEAKATPAYNRPADDWRPRSVCSLTMDQALREMEFPSRLAGAEWVLE